MSKLNRKEFKSLLLEWNKNFISERDFKTLDIPEWETSISKQQEEEVKSVNFNAEMINFPVPKFLLRKSDKTKLHKIFKNQFTIFEKNEKNYNLIKDAIKDFYKNVVLDIESYGDEIEDYKYQVEIEPAYNKENITFNSKEIFDKEIILRNIENLFEQKKHILTGKSKEDDFPFFVYFTKVFSEIGEMSEGGMFKISKLPENVSRTFLKWLFHHDFFHVLQMYGANRIGQQIKKLDRKYLEGDVKKYSFIKVKGLEGSLSSTDNFASVIPYILSKSQEEARDFLEENYLSYDEYKNQHASFNYYSTYGNKHVKSIDDFRQEKEENINKILEDLIEIKDNFNAMLDSLKDYIIIAGYDISGS